MAAPVHCYFCGGIGHKQYQCRAPYPGYHHKPQPEPQWKYDWAAPMMMPTPSMKGKGKGYGVKPFDFGAGWGPMMYNPNEGKKSREEEGSGTQFTKRELTRLVRLLLDE